MNQKSADVADRPDFEARLARTPAEREAAERLRFKVFVEELGAGGDAALHAERRERDKFDDVADHLLLFDHNLPEEDSVVGVYRLFQGKNREKLGGFYSEGEYDLTHLLNSGKSLLELGRSCLAVEYRGGEGMYHMWQALARYVEEEAIDILFGVASFHGTDVGKFAEPLSHLYHAHLAPPEIRPRSLEHVEMNRMPPEEVNRLRAIREIPALIKGYLRLGGMVGDGVFVDHAFNTIDVCLLLDTSQLSERHRQIYAGQRA